MSVIKNAKQIETEIKNEPKLDLSLLRKKGNSKTFKGLLLQKMKEVKKQGNLEVCQLIEWCYKRYCEFETSERVKFESWRGKSGVKFIDKPDFVVAERYRKRDIGELPTKSKIIIQRQFINEIILAINKLYNGDELIETCDIAELVYKRKWKNIFATRPDHILLVEVLNYLEYKNKIHYYRSGKIKILEKTL